MQKAGMDREGYKALLPKVGEILTRKPHLHKSLGIESPTPKTCVVVYVNADHLWYRVRFDNGTYECYKVPHIEDAARGGWSKR